jgi:hypothetical protein
MEGRKRRKNRAQQAGLGLRHRPVRIDGLTFQALMPQLICFQVALATAGANSSDRCRRGKYLHFFSSGPRRP